MRVKFSHAVVGVVREQGLLPSLVLRVWFVSKPTNDHTQALAHTCAVVFITSMVDVVELF